MLRYHLRLRVSRLLTSMERWLSGRKHRSWKPAMWKHPWVRIPLSPPNGTSAEEIRHLRKYPSGRRGSPAKGVGGLKTRARVQIPPSAPSRDYKKDVACKNPDFIGVFCCPKNDFSELENRRWKIGFSPLQIDANPSSNWRTNKNSKCQRWIKRETSRRIRSCCSAPAQGDFCRCPMIAVGYPDEEFTQQAVAQIGDIHKNVQK